MDKSTHMMTGLTHISQLLLEQANSNAKVHRRFKQPDEYAWSNEHM